MRKNRKFFKKHRHVKNKYSWEIGDIYFNNLTREYYICKNVIINKAFWIKTSGNV
jgi:hypothetical protein